MAGSTKLHSRPGSSCISEGGTKKGEPTALELGLRLRGTFIDCYQRETSLSPRAQSEPGGYVSWSPSFEFEHKYVKSLGETRKSAWRDELQKQRIKSGPPDVSDLSSDSGGEHKAKVPPASNASEECVERHDTRSSRRTQDTAAPKAPQQQQEGRATTTLHAKDLGGPPGQSWDCRSSSQCDARSEPSNMMSGRSVQDRRNSRLQNSMNPSVPLREAKPVYAPVVAPEAPIGRNSGLEKSAPNKKAREDTQWRETHRCVGMDARSSARSDASSQGAEWGNTDTGHGASDYHQQFQNVENQAALRMKMRQSAQQISEGWGSKSGLATAVAAMEEIPKRVGEGMYKVASHIVDNVQRRVASMSELIRAGETSNNTSEKVIRNLQSIPTMVHNLLEARVEKAKATVRHRVRGMIQNFSAVQEDGSNNQEQLVAQMRMISAEAEKIASEAVEAAARECRAHATRQLDFALSALKEPKRTQVISTFHQGANGEALDSLEIDVALAQTDNWEKSVDERWFRQTAEEIWPNTQVAESSSVAVVQDTSYMPCSVNNEVVADQLLRAKVLRNAGEISDGPLEQAENPGSMGHPNLCPRACIYYAMGNCANGRDCGFCHMPHPKRPVRLDKRHREALKRMPFSELINMLLPLLKDKARNLSSEPEAQGALLEATAAGDFLSVRGSAQPPSSFALSVGHMGQMPPGPSDAANLAAIGVQSFPLAKQAPTPPGRVLRSAVAPPQSPTPRRAWEAPDQSVQAEVMELLDSLLTTAALREKVSPGPATTSRTGMEPHQLSEGHSSRRSNAGSSAVSTVSDDSKASWWKKDGLFGALEVMSLRSLLTMLRRMSPPGAEEERALMDRVLHKLQEHSILDLSRVASSAAVSEDAGSRAGSSVVAHSMSRVPAEKRQGPASQCSKSSRTAQTPRSAAKGLA